MIEYYKYIYLQLIIDKKQLEIGSLQLVLKDIIMTCKEEL